MTTFALTILPGAWTFMAIVVAFGFALVLALYTRTGSGINEHPYARRYGDAPGADTDRRRVTGRDGIATLTSRGTR